MTYNGCKVMAKAHMAIDNTSYIHVIKILFFIHEHYEYLQYL
jgi:hypothetical protein